MFKYLYYYEMKKIWCRKLIWIVLVIMAGIVVFSAYSPMMGDTYVNGELSDSHKNIQERQMVNSRALSGRILGEILLNEIHEGYEKLPAGVEQFTVTEEYEQYLIPLEPVINYIWKIMDAYQGSVVIFPMDISEEELYEARLSYIRKSWISGFLTQGEREYWEKQEEQLDKPFIWQYAGAYEKIGENVYTWIVMAVLMIAICFSKIFSGEHSQKTSPLILSSRFGRSTLYYAKIAAGITSSLLLGLIVFGLGAAVIFGIWGFDGGNAAIQMVLPFYSGVLSMGEAVLICLLLLFTGMILSVIFTMVLSEKCKSGVGTMAIVVGILILSGFLHIPGQYRIISQLWDMIPSNMVAVWNIFDERLIPAFGHYYTMWQAVPFIWLLLSVMLVWYGKRIYGNIL
ncbi:MAG: ABC transporter permease subunit [Lachnospiraceae bacterium]|nr:ABC transporter permease subunit [Lachnospiraceae bacterium]